MPALTIADLDGQLFADVPEVAQLLRNDERTIRRAIERGEIPAIRTGKRWRVPTAWLRRVAGLETGPETSPATSAARGVGVPAGREPEERGPVIP